MKDHKNILIIVGGYDKVGVGEQFINSMIEGYPKKNIFRFSPVSGKLIDNDHFHDYKVYQHSIKTSALPGLSSFNFWTFRKKHLSLCLSKIKNVILTKKIDVVWGFLNSPIVIQIMSEIKTLTKNKIVTHIWDTPEYLAKSLRLDLFTRKKMLQFFDEAMTSAKHSITVSDYMSLLYKEKFNHPSTPMVFCPPKESWKPYKNKINKLDKIKIVFAGSLYAYKPWESFLDAVEQRNNSNAHKKIKVTCIGNISRRAKKRPWVNYEKLKPLNDASTAVNEADIAYLPYWMSPKYSFFVKTAFPGKMSFYIASGTPVLFHGPKDSTPTNFINQQKVGVSCHSFNSAEILNSIDILLSKKFLDGFEHNQQRTLHEVFHPDRCKEIFNNTIQSLA